MKLLLSAGAEVNAPASEEDGRTALQAAAEYGNFEIWKFLSDVRAEENTGSVLQAAAEFGKIEAIELLLRAGAEINAPAGRVRGRTALQAAVSAHNIKATSILLKAGADIDAPASEVEGWSVLYAAFQCNLQSCDIAERLLLRISYLSDLKGKQAAFRWAVHHGRISAVRYLLECGTDPNTPGDWFFLSPLSEAISKQNHEIAILLLNSGAVVNKRPSKWYSETPLQRAIQGEDIDMMNLLIARGADLSSSSRKYGYLRKENCSSLYAAISQHATSIEVIRALIDAGAIVNGEGPHETTPLQAASRVGRMDLIKMLLDVGANINAPPAARCGYTALQAAVNAQNLHLVRFLLQNGADVNASAAEIRGATALQRAAIVGHLRITLELLEAGADTHAPGARKEGRTALEAAAEHGRLDILHLLVKNDTQKETLGVRCEEAAELATKKGRLVIARVLRGYMKS